MKVLIADDSLTTRIKLKKNLLDWGYQVVEAVDGDVAWSLLCDEQDPPRMAILDWEMPGCDGVSLCQRLESREGGRFVYRLLLTGRSESHHLVEALSRGAHHFISKPASMVELQAHLNVGRKLVEANDKIAEYARLMAAQAQTDVLTGVANRRRFMEVASHAFERARRYDELLGVLMLDIDHFKQLNDRYGHAIGDQALEMTAACCADLLRDSDLFGRLGGEEFAALLIGADDQTALSTAERLRESIGRLCIRLDDDQQIRWTVSLGVAVMQASLPGFAVLLKRADEALYRAKDNGRNCSMTWSSVGS